MGFNRSLLLWSLADLPLVAYSTTGSQKWLPIAVALGTQLKLEGFVHNTRCANITHAFLVGSCQHFLHWMCWHGRQNSPTGAQQSNEAKPLRLLGFLVLAWEMSEGNHGKLVSAAKWDGHLSIDSLAFKDSQPFGCESEPAHISQIKANCLTFVGVCCA